VFWQSAVHWKPLKLFFPHDLSLGASSWWLAPAPEQRRVLTILNLSYCQNRKMRSTNEKKHTRLLVCTKTSSTSNLHRETKLLFFFCFFLFFCLGIIWKNLFGGQSTTQPIPLLSTKLQFLLCCVCYFTKFDILCIPGHQLYMIRSCDIFCK